MNHLSQLNKKLEAAKAEYEVANAALQKACSAFENGPKKDFAQLQQNIAALQVEIKSHQGEQATLKQTLSDELRTSNGAKTTKVKETLAAIRDIESVLEECGVLEQQLTANAEEAHIQASKLAYAYRDAYAHAKYKWAVMNMFTVLAECGERMAAAMAVNVGDDSEFSTKRTPHTIMLSELGILAKAYEGDTEPYLSVIGTLDLGTFKTTKIMTPGEIAVIRSKK
jgi:predicted  nucleic acid-binding Zn-ribbon protein